MQKKLEIRRCEVMLEEGKYGLRPSGRGGGRIPPMRVSGTAERAVRIGEMVS